MITPSIALSCERSGESATRVVIGFPRGSRASSSYFVKRGPDQRLADRRLQLRVPLMACRTAT